MLPETREIMLYIRYWMILPGFVITVSQKNLMNAEARFMFAKDDNVAIMLGYGYRF